MLEALLPMGTVLLSWLLFFLLFSGLGLAALRLLGQPLTSGWLWLDSFWLGWALALCLLQIWHFAFPVAEGIALLFGLAAAFLLLGQRRQLRLISQRFFQDKVWLLILFLTLLWLSNRALGATTAFDTGFRDMQAVMWIDSYKIVPGLSNLFTSLAFNHSVYLYDALLDVAIWEGRSFYIATGLLITVYLFYALRAALSLARWRAAAGWRWSWVFATLTMPHIFFYTVSTGGITHFLTDAAVDLLGFLTLIYLLDFLQDCQPNTATNRYQVFRLAIIILAGCTVKHSYVIFGLGVGALAFAVWLRRGGRGARRAEFAKIGAPALLLAGSFMLPWLARGVITSGYPVFPYTVGRFEVDWAQPIEMLEERQLRLAVNTRQRGSDPAVTLSSTAWLGPWLADFVGNIAGTMLPTVIFSGGLCLYLAGLYFNRRKKPRPALGLWLLAPIFFMLVVWFRSAPATKYVQYLFWSLAALSALLALLVWPTLSWSLRRLGLYALLALCLAYFGFSLLRNETFYLLPAGSEGGFHPHWQHRNWQPPYEEFKTDSGLIVNVPAFGHGRCWRAPLPCTPHPAAQLEERSPGHIEAGFRFAPAD